MEIRKREGSLLHNSRFNFDGSSCLVPSFDDDCDTSA